MAALLCQPRFTFLQFSGSDDKEIMSPSLKRANSAPDLRSLASIAQSAEADQVYAKGLVERADKLSFLPQDKMDASSEVSTMSPVDECDSDVTEHPKDFTTSVGQYQVELQTRIDNQRAGFHAGQTSLQWLGADPTVNASDLRVKQNSKVARQRKADTKEPPAATTLMICNIPCMVVPQHLVTAIDSLGFEAKYDLVYLPAQLCADDRKAANLGYGFVNFKTPEYAREFQEAFGGYQFAGTCSKKVCCVKVARIQGREANLKAASRALKTKAKFVDGVWTEMSVPKNTHRVHRAKHLLLPEGTSPLEVCA